MEQQLDEESKVLGELKEKEEADLREFEQLQSEQNEKNKTISSLTGALKAKDGEIAKLEADLRRAAEEYKALVKQHDLQSLKIEDLSSANQRLLRSLKDKYGDYISELKAANAEAAEKEAQAAALRKELASRKTEIDNLSRELMGKTAEFKAVLDKERADFRQSFEKMGYGSAQTEKKLLSEIETLKESIWHKDAEAVHAETRIRNLLDKQKALEECYEGRLLELRELNAAVKEERDSALNKVAEQDIFAKSAASALKEKEEELKILKSRMDDVLTDLSQGKTIF